MRRGGRADRVAIAASLVVAALSAVWLIGMLAGWWPYEWWTSFGLGTPQ